MRSCAPTPPRGGRGTFCGAASAARVSHREISEELLDGRRRPEQLTLTVDGPDRLLVHDPRELLGHSLSMPSTSSGLAARQALFKLRDTS